MPLPDDHMRLPGVDDQLKKMFVDPATLEKVEKERDEQRIEIARLRSLIDELEEKVDWYEKRLTSQ